MTKMLPYGSSTMMDVGHYTAKNHDTKNVIEPKWAPGPTPNTDERRGRAQRFDRSRASPPDRSCFCSITSSSSWILMIWWMQYSTINKNPFAHGTRGWDWLVRWRGSMEWSNSKTEPTKNWINHGRLGGGKPQSTIATVSTAGGISLSPNSNIHSFE